MGETTATYDPMGKVMASKGAILYNPQNRTRSEKRLFRQNQRMEASGAYDGPQDGLPTGLGPPPRNNNKAAASHRPPGAEKGGGGWDKPRREFHAPTTLAKGQGAAVTAGSEEEVNRLNSRFRATVGLGTDDWPALK